MPVFYNERFNLWVVTRYADIARILKDPTTFSSAQSLAVDTVVAPEVQAVLDTGYPATPTMVTDVWVCPRARARRTGTPAASRARA